MSLASITDLPALLNLATLVVVGLAWWKLRATPRIGRILLVVLVGAGLHLASDLVGVVTDVEVLDEHGEHLLVHLTLLGAGTAALLG